MATFLLPGYFSTGIYGQVSDTIRLSPVEYQYHQLYMPLYQNQIQTYDSSELSIFTGQTLSQLLRQGSHLIIKSYGASSLSTASFRGKAASHTGVFWNGIRINSPLVGQVDMNSIPINAIQGLTILPGNASFRSGSGALGGAIILGNSLHNLCDNCEEGHKMSLSGLQEIGSYGKHNTILSYQQALGTFNFGLSAYHSNADNDFTFLNTAIRNPRIDTQRNAQYLRWGATANLQFIPQRPESGEIHDTLNYAIWYQQFQRQIPPLMPDLGVERDERQEDISLRSTIQYKLKRRGQTHNLTVGLNSEKTIYSLFFLIPHQEPYEQFNSYSNFTSLQLHYVFKTVIHRFHHLLLSTRNTYQWADYHARRTGAGYKAQRYTNQVQAAYRYNFKHGFHAEIVGNLTSYLPGETEFNGSIGFFYKHILKETDASSSRWTMGAEIGRNTHQPTLNDLYWEPGGNPDLSTEKAIEFSLPIQYIRINGGNRLSFQLSPYYSQVRDWILWKPTRYRFWEPINIRNVTSSGIEVHADWNYTGKTTQSSLKANYSFSPTIETSDNQSWNFSYQQLPYIPLHQFQFSYRLSLIKMHTSLLYAIQLNGARYTDSPFVGKRSILSAYNVQDIQLSYVFTLRDFRSRILFRINNIWDSAYQSIKWRPMPGRNYNLLIQINLNQ